MKELDVPGIKIGSANPPFSLNSGLSKSQVKDNLWF
jgi:hypothetical protein